MTYHYVTKTVPKLPLSSFCVGCFLRAMFPTIKRSFFPWQDSIWKKKKKPEFSFASDHLLEVASELGIVSCNHSSFSLRTPSGTDLCRLFGSCIIVCISVHEYCSCWFEGPCFFGVLHLLWILWSSCLLFPRVPWLQREGIWRRLPILDWVSHSLLNVRLSVSLCVPLCFQGEALWWLLCCYLFYFIFTFPFRTVVFGLY